MTNLFTCLSKKSFTPGNGSGMDREWIENGSVCSRKLFASIIFLILLSVGEVFGADNTITINKSALTNLSDSYDNGATKTNDISNVTFTYSYLMYNSTNIQSQANNGNIYNSTLIPGKIKSVAITHSGTGRSTTIYMGTSSSSITTQAATGSGSITGSTPSNTCPGYFKITRGSNAAYWSKVEVTYTPATITLSTSSITGLDYNVGSGPSAEQSFTISGSNIPANLTVTAPTNFQVKVGSGSWGSSATITVTLSGSAAAGTLSSTTVYVRLASGKSAGDYSGNVSIAMVGCNTISGVNPKTVAVSGTVTTASCGSATPSATGAASLNGSFNMTSTTSAIGVASGTWGPGTNCSWSDYGFVWSDGTTTTTPTVSNNKVQVGTSGTATSWTGSVTPSGSTTPTSWTTGHTYYVRAYGKNNNGSATYAYGSAWSFTPYSVTFKANGGTGSDKVQYVRGGVSTTLTSNSFTKTGYTFNGWNTDADGTSGTGYTNGQSVSLSANLTLYAKWSVKTTNITLNKNNSDASGSTAGSASYTYGESTKNSYTAATRTGYTLNGYYTATSAGTKILNADGTLAGDNISVSTTVYTSSGNWAYDNTSLTLYAQWTIKNYTITWKVKGETWSDKGGSTNANYNTAWSSLTLPTAPDPENDGCGQKFVGWTTTEDYSNATTAPTDLLNSDNKSGKTAVKITDDVVFYAVFADYDE